MATTIRLTARVANFSGGFFEFFHVRAASATRYPAAASSLAHALPIPRLAPVTSAVLRTHKFFLIIMGKSFQSCPSTIFVSFIRALEKSGELNRIPFEVDPYLEITEFADRAVKNGGPALLFEKPKGRSVPVLINAFASMRRMEIALGVDSVEEIAERICGFLQMQKPEGLIGQTEDAAEVGGDRLAFPEHVSNGPCKEVIRRTDFSLDEFPDSALLARRRRPFHYATDGLLTEPRNGQAQLRHVPHAGV